MDVEIWGRGLGLHRLRDAILVTGGLRTLLVDCVSVVLGKRVESPFGHTDVGQNQWYHLGVSAPWWGLGCSLGANWGFDPWLLAVPP